MKATLQKICCISLALLTNNLSVKSQTTEQCGTTQNLEHIKKQGPKFEQKMTNYELQIPAWIQKNV